MNKNRGLPVDWVKHLPTEERKKFEDVVRNDTLVLGRLADILEEKLIGLENREASLLDYENPSWAYRQAHMNGLKAGLTNVLKLLAFLK